MKVNYLFLAAFLILFACKNADYTVEPVENPPFRPNVEFLGFEDLSHPGFQHLIEKISLLYLKVEKEIHMKICFYPIINNFFAKKHYNECLYF